MEQRDRVYVLEVGDYRNGNGLRITEAQISFDISKSSDNKRNNGNSAAIEIYNLTPDQIKLLESEYITCTFSVGYAGIGARVVVQGNVVEIDTRKVGTDFVTQLKMGEGYTDLNHQDLRSVVSPGKKVADVIEEIRQQMPGVARGSYTGTNLNNPVVHGWRLNGTPREALRKLCEAHNIEYSVTGGTLNITDDNGLTTKNTILAPLISPETGLIDAPFFVSERGKKGKSEQRRRRGIQFKALLNTECVPGQLIKVESPFITGHYRVNSTRFSGDFRGGEWYVECVCSEVEAEDLL